MRISREDFAGRRVWISGHTGFKGSWLCEWLLGLGAEIWGFSLAPATDPALFTQLALAGRIRHHEIGDVRDAAAVRAAVARAQPDLVFHLAAQPLVRESYVTPVETYAVNVMGTIHVLEALRQLSRPCAAVMVTTDKCYENREWTRAYSEEDPLGGHDPYSSSKAAAEIAIASWRRSFFPPARVGAGQATPVAIASARAGNVIGGGDWAKDRILPDCMRALAARQPIPVRNPQATRPWQHVLEPLGGYLCLAAQLHRALVQPAAGQLEQLCSAFNFGPAPDSNRPVLDVVAEILRHWPGEWRDVSDPTALHEAGLLNLAIDKARHVLDWTPHWSFADTIRHTVAWYRHGAAGTAGIDAADFTRQQIAAYTNPTPP